ncbi:MAG: hypothetical protein EBS05_27720, partial [Proteobacteria bacterium]|nr:hypothetical protein [Pseudomonadota bacterium]
MNTAIAVFVALLLVALAAIAIASSKKAANSIIKCNRSADCAQNANNKFCAPNPSGEGGLCGPTATANGNVVCNPTYGDGDCAGNATNTYCAAPPGGGGDAAAFRCAPETARAAVQAAAQAKMMATEANYPLGSYCQGDWQCASGHCLGADWAQNQSGTCSSKADAPAPPPPPPPLQNGDYCSANSQCASGACGWRDASRATGTVCCQSTVTVNGAQYCAGGMVSLDGPCWYSSQCPGTPAGITCQGANIAAGTPGICSSGLANGTSCTESSQCTSRFCAAS